MVIEMDKTVKRQLGLSFGLLVVVLMTLMFWYDNFIFHTYIDQKQYQACYQAGNEDIQIENIELYQNKHGSYFGNGRMMSLKNSFFLKGDFLTLTYTGEIAQDHTFTLKQEYTIQDNNEVCLLNHQKTKDNYDFEKINDLEVNIQIQRQNKIIYDQNLTMNKVKLITYIGSNKDYTIQNVYVTPTWLKTGILSFDEKDVSQDYQYCTIDYLVLKDNGNPENLDDYLRFAHISQSIKEMKKKPYQEAYFYDLEGSLLDKEIRCIISLQKDEKDKEPMVFSINLHKTLQEDNRDA